MLEGLSPLSPPISASARRGEQCFNIDNYKFSEFHISIKEAVQILGVRTKIIYKFKKYYKSDQH